MNPTCKKIIQNLMQTEDVQKALNEDNWSYIFDLFGNTFPAMEMIGEFTDMLVKADIDFCSYMTVVPAYAFYKSTLLKEANLRNATDLKSRCFRKSAVNKIYLSKDNLKDIDVGIFSAIDHDVLIIWDGSYAEWSKLRKNSNCYYNFIHTATIKCVDGEYKENKENN